MTKFLYRAGLALLLALATLQLQAAERDTSRLLVLGDSLSAAYQMPEASGWVSLLQQRLDEQQAPWQVINAAISGETTQGGLSRLPGLLAQHQPQLVLIELGGNDGLRGIPLQTIRHNLTSLIEYSQAAGAQVVLAGMTLPPNYGRTYVQRFTQLYPQLAETYDLPLIPFLLEGVADQPGLMMADGIHPTATAQTRVLDNVWLVLEPLLQ